MKSNYMILGLAIFVIILGILRCEKIVYKVDDTLPQIVTEPNITVTDSTAIISWTTDEPSNGLVRYGENAGIYNIIVSDSNEYCLNHSFLICNLSPHTNYFFVVESADFFGNGPAISDEQSFITEHNEYSYAFVGWALFEEANYDSAVVCFESARLINHNYADMFTGLGWCYTKIESLLEAANEFSSAINLDELALDAYAGRSAVSLKLEYPFLAIEDALAILNTDSLYVFSHDTTVTCLDLHLILAECYYQTQQYSLAHQEVEYLANAFDLAFILDKNDNSTWTNPINPIIIYASYEEALLMWIQCLKDYS